MSQSHHHHHHGSATRGRAMAIVGCLLIIAANAFVFKDARDQARPILFLQLCMAISLIWILAGTWAMCVRLVWGRFFVLTVLYIGTIGFFIATLISITTEGGPLEGRLTPLFIAGVIYLVVSLALTKSRNVRRLTSRAWE
jgi:hypothetical protein